MLTLAFCPCPLADWWQWFGDQRWSAHHTLRAPVWVWEGKRDLPSLWYVSLLLPSVALCSPKHSMADHLHPLPTPACAHEHTRRHKQVVQGLKLRLVSCATLTPGTIGSTLDGFTTGSQPTLLPWIQSSPKKLSVSKGKFCSCLFFCGGVYFSDCAWNYSNKRLTCSHGNQGHLILLILLRPPFTAVFFCFVFSTKWDLFANYPSVPLFMP